MEIIEIKVDKKPICKECMFNKRALWGYVDTCWLTKKDITRVKTISRSCPLKEETNG